MWDQSRVRADFNDGACSIMRATKSPETIAASYGIGEDATFGRRRRSISRAAIGFRALIGRARMSIRAREIRPATNWQIRSPNWKAARRPLLRRAGWRLLIWSCPACDRMTSSWPHNCYGGTYRLLGLRAAKRQFEVAFVDQNDPTALGAAFERIPSSS